MLNGNDENDIAAYFGNLLWDEEAKSYRTYHFNGTKYKTLRGVLKPFSEHLKNTVETRKKEEADRVAKTAAIERIRNIAGVKGNRHNDDSVSITTKKYGFDLELTPNSAGKVYVRMRYSSSIPVGQLAELLENL